MGATTMVSIREARRKGVITRMLFSSSLELCMKVL